VKASFFLIHNFDYWFALSNLVSNLSNQLKQTGENNSQIKEKELKNLF